ncbi:MAG: 1,4-alpha-glucan branching enzyme, partial [Pseudomonadota bacterium]
MSEPVTLSPEEAGMLERGEHTNPFSALGPHQMPDGRWSVHALVHGAERVHLVTPAGAAIAEMARLSHEVFVTTLPAHPGRYRLTAERGSDAWTLDDPYSFGPVIGE